MQDKLDVFCQHILAREAYLEAKPGASYEIPGWQKALFSHIPKSLNYALHRYMY